MFYAHFVLSKKGPLARIWLAAHWDKKLTKAHVFETNISSSVEAILEPKVKMALRTSGHLLLGVVRIYSRKAKYLLADCNEAFVKIKMAFRPGVVDLPEENREAAVAAITLPETFHDFDTTMADLNDIDVNAQFSVNQSRPEEITMREDFGNITLVGDDGFGDIGFDDREMLRDATLGVEDSLYKNPDSSNILLDSVRDKSKDAETSLPKPMDMDLSAPIKDDGFGGAMDGGMLARAPVSDDDDDDGGPIGGDDDDDDDDNFGGDVDHALFGEGFMEGGPLFEDAPMAEVSMVSEVAPMDAHAKQVEKIQAVVHDDGPETTGVGVSTIPNQTTLVQNEEEAFALEPLDVTSVHGTEKRAKRKRKLIVDEQKCIQSETMKLQLSDASDILTTLDLAPPTKKLMHWKETGGVEKLFALPGRALPSRVISKLFNKNLVTQAVTEEDQEAGEKIELAEEPEVPREEEQQPTFALDEILQPPEQDTTIVPQEKSTTAEPEKKRSRKEKAADKENRLEKSSILDHPPVTPGPEDNDVGLIDFQDNVDMPVDLDGQPVEETAEQEEIRWNKRSLQMLHSLQTLLKRTESIKFQEVTGRNNRKQAASKFYALLVLKKQDAVNVVQSEPYTSIHISRGPRFTAVF